MKIRQRIYRLSFIIIAVAFSLNVFSQRVALKTNALYWATLSPNIGLEFRLSRHFTLNIEGAGNLFKSNKYKTHTAAFMPEGRYWFSSRPQAGHFIGVMGTANFFKWKINDTHHNGDALGLGLTYGYSFVLNKRWSLETTLGAGWLHFRDIKYKEGEKAPSGPNHSKDLFAPLKAGVTFVYHIK